MTKMGSGEVWAKCQQCGTELKEGDKVCPKCGSTKKAFTETCEVKIGVKVGASVEHEAHWSSKSWTILGVILAVVTLLLTVLLPSPSFWTRIAIGMTVLVVVLVLTFNNKTRYSFLMFIRWLDRKFTAKKIHRDV